MRRSRRAGMALMRRGACAPFKSFGAGLQLPLIREHVPLWVTGYWLLVTGYNEQRTTNNEQRGIQNLEPRT